MLVRTDNCTEYMCTPDDGAVLYNVHKQRLRCTNCTTFQLQVIPNSSNAVFADAIFTYVKREKK